jgi:hypothetical protein
MSSTTSQRLDAARKQAREAEQALQDAHPALAGLPRDFLTAYAELCRECYSPTKQSDELGVAVTGHAAGTRTPRRNEAAIQEKRRIDAQLTRIATRLRGDQAGEGGTFERIVYGKDRRWTASSAHSTSTRMTA